MTRMRTARDACIRQGQQCPEPEPRRLVFGARPVVRSRSAWTPLRPEVSSAEFSDQASPVRVVLKPEGLGLYTYVLIRTYIRLRAIGQPSSVMSAYLSNHQLASIDGQGERMIILGIILLLIGFIAKIAILWSIGIILLVVGLVLVVLGSVGRAVGGRRHYY
jgi:hypothetical protein